MGKKMPATIINLDGISAFPKWYTIVTKYNYERKLAENIMGGIEKVGLSENIFEVLVPIKETTETYVNSKGKRAERIKHEKVYPLYIFIKAIMNESVWDYIKNSEGSSTILAPSGFPIAIEEDEILRIKQQCGLVEIEYENFDPEIGQDVYIQDGMFKGRYGKIARIQNSGITVDIGGVPIKLDISLLERVEFVD